MFSFFYFYYINPTPPPPLLVVVSHRGPARRGAGENPGLAAAGQLPGGLQRGGEDVLAGAGGPSHVHLQEHRGRRGPRPARSPSPQDGQQDPPLPVSRSPRPTALELRRRKRLQSPPLVGGGSEGKYF